MIFEKGIGLRAEEYTHSIYLKPLLIDMFEVNQEEFAKKQEIIYRTMGISLPVEVNQL